MNTVKNVLLNILIQPYVGILETKKGILFIRNHFEHKKICGVKKIKSFETNWPMIGFSTSTYFAFNSMYAYTLKVSPYKNGVNMSEALNTLNNIRTLRSQARGVTLEILEGILDKFISVVEDRRSEDKTRQEHEGQHAAKIEKLRQLMLDDGIDPTELLKFTPTRQKEKKERIPRPARYKYVDENGNEKTWTGQGRTPKSITEQIASGSKTLDDFLL